MEENLLNIDYRKKVINEIKGDENIQRKLISYKKQNMQNDNFYQYVKEHLESKLDPGTVSELNIFANVNLQRRISKSESSIYKRKPDRNFFSGSKDLDEIHDIYEDMDIDTVLKRANEAYKYQDQCAIQIFPEGQKLNGRVLLPHHYDVIPDSKNPEKAMAYIISNFDNTDRDEIRRANDKTGSSQGNDYRDGINQEIGDYDDSELNEERFYWWSKTYNFVTDGHGRILDKETEEGLDLKVQSFGDENAQSFIDDNILSPLKDFGVVPFVDIASAKDFEFWVRPGNSLFDATLIYNVILTSEFQTVEMQGHAQPYYKGDAEHMPENVRIGVDKMIFIPINPNNPVQAEFGFANPGSDLGGIRDFRESYLAAFLSSRGLDTSVISGQSNVQTASSGIEKMLQMVEKFEASQEDFSLFKTVENNLLKIVIAWVNAFRSERRNGELILNEKYQKNIPAPEQIALAIDFARPELVKTEMEVLQVAEKEIDMGVSSRVHYLMDHKGMTKEQAIAHLKEIEEFESSAPAMNIEAVGAE